MMNNLFKDIYRVIVAKSGEKAIKIVVSDPQQDLVLLDIMMPGMDGYEVCWRLKHHHNTLNIPVIFLTGKTDMEDEKKGLALGAVDFIIKPIRPDIVIARVKNHLATKLKEDRMQNENENLEIEVATLKHSISLNTLHTHQNDRDAYPIPNADPPKKIVQAPAAFALNK
jgi:putative two-component system response regulator